MPRTGINSLKAQFPDKNKSSMPSEHSSDVKFEIGHVLFIDIVGYSKLLINEQSEQIGSRRPRFEVIREIDAERMY